MTIEQDARERAKQYFVRNRSLLKRLSESESDVGYFSAQILQELETDFAAALLEFRKEGRKEMKEEASKLMCHACDADTIREM